MPIVIHNDYMIIEFELCSPVERDRVAISCYINLAVL